MISAKIHNQIVVVRRYARSKYMDMNKQCTYMRILQTKAAFADTIESMMGYEGNAARTYFLCLSNMVEDVFQFSGRNRRPSLDPFNAMLNLGYSLLLNEVYGKIDGKGLNPYFGFIHQDREKHPTLASDLMEEWRPVIVDSTVMALINGHEIRKEHFQSGISDDGVYFTKEGMDIFLRKMESRFRQENRYLNYLDYPVSFRQAIGLQVKAIAEVIETKDVDKYNPLWIR